MLRILVERICVELSKTHIENKEGVVPLENMWRLMEQYRYDCFDWSDPHEHCDILAKNRTTNAEMLARSLVHATGTELFPGDTHDTIAIRIQEGLKNFSSGKHTEGVENAKKFFALLEQKLKAV